MVSGDLHGRLGRGIKRLITGQTGGNCMGWRGGGDPQAIDISGGSPSISAIAIHTHYTAAAPDGGDGIGGGSPSISARAIYTQKPPLTAATASAGAHPRFQQ